MLSRILEPHLSDRGQAVASLAPSLFSTDQLEPHQQFDAWHARWGTTVELTDAGSQEGSLSARSQLWAIGDMALSRVALPASRAKRSQLPVHQDGFDHWVIGFLLSGTIRHRVGGTLCTISPGQMFVFSLAEEFGGDRTDCEWLILFLPRDAARELLPALIRTRRRPIETPVSALFCDYLRALEHRLPAMTKECIGPLREVTRTLLMACLGHDAEDAAAEPVDDLRLARIHQIISAHLKSPMLGPKKLCRLAGISRSHLYRLFEPHGGVARYIQSQRLHAIHDALSDAECRQSIWSIAEEFGFTDASTFGRAFRVEFGYRPSDVRAGSRGSPRALSPSPCPGFADPAGATDLLRRFSV